MVAFLKVPKSTYYQSFHKKPSVYEVENKKLRSVFAPFTKKVMVDTVRENTCTVTQRKRESQYQTRTTTHEKSWYSLEHHKKVPSDARILTT